MHHSIKTACYFAELMKNNSPNRYTGKVQQMGMEKLV